MTMTVEIAMNHFLLNLLNCEEKNIIIINTYADFITLVDIDPKIGIRFCKKIIKLKYDNDEYKFIITELKQIIKITHYDIYHKIINKKYKHNKKDYFLFEEYNKFLKHSSIEYFLSLYKNDTNSKYISTSFTRELLNMLRYTNPILDKQLTQYLYDRLSKK